MARPEGFEPPAYGFEVRCSIQLSYGRVSHKATASKRCNGLYFRYGVSDGI